MTLLRACHWVMRKRHANVNKPGGAESRSFYQRTCIPPKTHHLHPFAPWKNSHLIAIDQPFTSKIIIYQTLTSDIAVMKTPPSSSCSPHWPTSGPPPAVSAGSPRSWARKTLPGSTWAGWTPQMGSGWDTHGDSDEMIICIYIYMYIAIFYKCIK